MLARSCVRLAGARMSEIAMREIKFRAWSDASKHMTEWDVLRGLHVPTAFAKSSNYHLM
jgi:hypothetical protein